MRSKSGKTSLVVLRFAFLTHCPVPIFRGLKPQIALKKKKKRYGKRERQKVDCGKMWLRRSRSTGLATEKVEFVTKQREGWCFLSFVFLFFWCFILPLLFWIPAGSLAVALPPLSVAKFFGHIPLSYTLLHKIKLRDEKRHNLKRLGGGGEGKERSSNLQHELLKKRDPA